MAQRKPEIRTLPASLASSQTHLQPIVSRIVNANRIRDVVAPTAIALGGIVIFFLVHPLQKLFFVPAMLVALLISDL